MIAALTNRSCRRLALTGTFASLLFLPAARGEDLPGAALVRLLQQGGYVIVMRHARSPDTPPTADKADPENPGHQRQLDETGEETARAMGAAFKALHIPVGEVWSSPTYRALQTVQLADLPRPQTATEIGDGTTTPADGAAWLQAKVTQPPQPGTDTVIITHYPNITAALGKAADAPSDGEAIVFHPGETEPAAVVGRIKIEDWPKLAERR